MEAEVTTALERRHMNQNALDPQPQTEVYRIPLIGKNELFAIVDAEDFERISSHDWRPLYNVHCRSYYAVRAESRGGKQYLIYMHREILYAKAGEQVDHKFHDTLDNRKSQIRIATCSQNNRNQRIGRDNKSGAKGVSWCKYTGRWRVTTRINGKQRTLGRFDSLEAASRVYQEMAAKIEASQSRRAGPFAVEMM